VNVPSPEFREAVPGDEVVLLPMMRALAEPEPGAMHFDESATKWLKRDGK
jgi:hypothetical protein